MAPLSGAPSLVFERLAQLLAKLRRILVTMNADSMLDRGTTFRVYVPMHDAG